jgi:hypothetical protein
MTRPKTIRRPVTEKVGTRRHGGLLADPNVKAWYDERALRSRMSADVYLRQLGGMCLRLGLSPAEVAALGKSDQDRLRSLLIRYASDLKTEGRLDSYIAKTFDGLRSWLRARRVQFDSFPKLGAERGVSIERERVPSQEELHRVIERLTPRGRVIVLLMAHAGLRPGVIGAYGALDGLTLADLPELKLGKRPSFSEVPFVVRVPARLSKTRKAYTSFGTQELASAILGYLDGRTAHGEKLRPESPLVTIQTVGAAANWASSSKGFVTTKAVVKELRSILSASTPQGVSWRPYVCRSYCSTRLLIAEGSGKISRDLREAILGHDGGVAARYNVGKRWGEELLKEARAAYKRCEPFLSTTLSADPNSGMDDLLRVIAEKAGIPKDQLTSKSQGELADEVIRLLREERVKGSPAPSPSPSQRSVMAGEVDGLLQQGWRFVSSLGSDRAVLEAPPAPGDSAR